MKELDYKEKIKKLLALAESPNEYEAKAALLKARKLMAEHRLSEADLEENKNQKVKKILTDITCATRRDTWVPCLTEIIANNYWCKGFMSRAKYKQTRTVGFIGLENDVELCVKIFRYAIDCVISEIKAIEEKNKGRTNDYLRRLCDGYAYGFVKGVEEAFRKQTERETTWGLILQTPQAVLEAAQNLKKGRALKSDIELDSNTYRRGFNDGIDFKPERRLG